MLVQAAASLVVSALCRSGYVEHTVPRSVAGTGSLDATIHNVGPGADMTCLPRDTSIDVRRVVAAANTEPTPAAAVVVEVAGIEVLTGSLEQAQTVAECITGTPSYQRGLGRTQ